MDNIFEQPLDISVNKNNGTIPSFICIIEGWKTKIKNLHWSAHRMNTHKLLDEIAGFTSGYQDSLAEDYMGINGAFPSDFLKGVPSNCNDMRELLKEMLDKTKIFYGKIPSGNTYSGIASETETFIHNINKYIYLSNLCD